MSRSALRHPFWVMSSQGIKILFNAVGADPGSNPDNSHSLLLEAHLAEENFFVFLFSRQSPLLRRRRPAVVDLGPDLRDHHLPLHLPRPAHRHPHHHLHHRGRQRRARQIHPPLAQALSYLLGFVAQVAGSAPPRRCQKVQVKIVFFIISSMLAFFFSLLFS